MSEKKQYLIVTGERNGDRSKLGQAGGAGLLMYDEKTFTIATSQDQYILNAPLINVRRLTPRECERLQGFPDDYTLIPYKGKEASDAVRYHALGNSWAVPVVRWIGRRIMEVLSCN